MTFRRASLFFVLLLMSAAALLAQEQGGPAAPSGHQAQAAPQSAKPAHKASNEEDEFRQSASVKWLARVTGMQPLTVYWVSVVINFVIIAGLIAWGLKKKLPGYFRERTDSIRRQMEEARRTTEESRVRLAEIEARLARMDAEITLMSAEAEADWKREEQRIQEAAEQEKRAIVTAAEQEVAAAQKQAQRELKAYAAGLAVELAGQRIRVEPADDRALVRNFARELGKDGGQ